MKDDHSDSDLWETFATLREQEAAHAPSFQRVTTRARSDEAAARASGIWRSRSLAAGLIAVIALLALIRGIGPAVDPAPPMTLTEELPPFLAADPADAGLFGSVAARNASPTDSMLPLHLRFELF